MLGEVYMLEVSNMLMLLGSQTSSFLAKNIKGNSRGECTCSSWPINCYSAVWDVYSHPDTTTKRSSPSVNVTPTTAPTMTELPQQKMAEFATFLVSALVVSIS